MKKRKLQRETKVTLTKVKVKKSQEKYLNFAIELDMNDVNAMLYACAKTVESKLGVKLKKKRKPDKNKKPKWKINIEKEIETMRGEMSIPGAQPEIFQGRGGFAEIRALQ